MSGKKITERGAFPLISIDWKGIQYGCSKREYFAAKAMQGILVNNTGTITATAIAAASVDMANELIIKLAATEPP